MNKYIYMIIDTNAYEEDCDYADYEYFYVTTVLEDFLEKITHLSLHSDVNALIMMNHETNGSDRSNNIIFTKEFYCSNYNSMRAALYDLTKLVSNAKYLSKDIEYKIKRYIDDFIESTDFDELENTRRKLIDEQHKSSKINAMKQIADEFGYEVIKKE